MKIDREALAWAAGFFDGEGCVGASTHQGQLFFCIKQTEPTVLHRFRAALGGLGHVCGPYKQRNPRHSDFWSYNLCSFEGVQAACAMLWIFLSEPKKQQIKSALASYHGLATVRKRGPKGRSQYGDAHRS